jgi:hypothetical protein
MIFIVALCLNIFILVSRLISHVTFNSTNPIIAGVGLIKVYIFGVEYVIIEEEPQIIITKILCGKTFTMR